ncbi:MAG: GNAT family N-acetyltransferase [Bacteroidetes bacterium]|nr:GNAT family N-acetyltransferase [Bacteroidota bacterium]
MGGWTHTLSYIVTAIRKGTFRYDVQSDRKYQRQGLGMKLLRALQNYAKKNGFRAVLWLQMANQHALDFYRAADGIASDVKHFTFQTSF